MEYNNLYENNSTSIESFVKNIELIYSYGIIKIPEGYDNYL